MSKKKTGSLKGHEDLKTIITNIFELCQFEKLDNEVALDFDNDGEEEHKFDICALQNNTFLVVECKDRTEIKSIKSYLQSIKSYIEKIKKKKVKILRSEKNQITNLDLKKINDVKYCFAFTDTLSNKHTQKNIEDAGFIYWDHKAVKYYKKNSQTLKKLTQNELLKEFDVKPSKILVTSENAVEVKQNDITFYLLGMHPGLLQKIAYVYRRKSNKPLAYQRLINKDRLESIGNYFMNSPNLQLPNPVIIAFDNDPEIQEIVEFKKNRLHFPTSYCSAWIIDGQHRIFGFKDHPDYNKWYDTISEDFKIPVVAFKSLPEIEQTKNFININYYQKKIDAVLFNDLATVIKDLKQEITWPSLLVSELNNHGPWANRIKISELDEKKPISISGFAKTVLLYKLLGYNKKTKQYPGPLYGAAPFNIEKPFMDPDNQKAFSHQVNILNTFFQLVREHVYDKNKENDKWLNHKMYGLSKFTCVNALLLVLYSMLEKDKDLKMNMKSWISCIDVINFENKALLHYGRGYPAMPKIANKIIRKINKNYHAKLKPVKL